LSLTLQPRSLLVRDFIGEIIMKLKKLLVAILFACSFAVVAQSAFAGEDHACKTDADCEHGHHCHDGHCGE
jgi:hypothetical protein